MDANELRNALIEHNGFDQPYHHSLVKSFLYSPGVRCFAQNAGHGAYWMLDILATNPAVRAGVHEHEFCIVMLAVTGTKAMLTVARDYRGKPDANGVDIGGEFEGIVFQQEIAYTDCPEGLWKFYLIFDMMLLPSEY